MHKRACKHCKEELIKVKKIIIVSCKKRILTEIFLCVLYEYYAQFQCDVLNMKSSGVTEIQG